VQGGTLSVVTDDYRDTRTPTQVSRGEKERNEQ